MAMGNRPDLMCTDQGSAIQKTRRITEKCKEPCVHHYPHHLDIESMFLSEGSDTFGSWIVHDSILVYFHSCLIGKTTLTVGFNDSWVLIAFRGWSLIAPILCDENWGRSLRIVDGGRVRDHLSQDGNCFVTVTVGGIDALS